MIITYNYFPFVIYDCHGLVYLYVSFIIIKSNKLGFFSQAIVGCAGGATRAALTQHQARRNNMADVSAKDGSQETLVNLTALLFSLVLIPAVTSNQT